MFEEIDSTSETILSFIIDNQPVSPEQLRQKFKGLLPNTLEAHIIFLAEEKLIASDGDNYYSSAFGTVYFKRKLKSRVYAVARSIIAPVIVSAITTLLTLKLNGISIQLILP